MPIVATTITQMIGAAERNVPVASPAGFAVGGVALCDSEYMWITSVTGNVIGVVRGMEKTAATPHPNGSPIFAGDPRDFAPLLGNIGPSRPSTVPIGNAAYNAMGTSATHVAGTLYWAEIFIPAPMLVRGIAVLNGATAGTNNMIYSLYRDVGGMPIATTPLTGTLSAGPDTFQSINLVSPVVIPRPGRYYVGVQCNGTTATTRRIAANTFLLNAGSQAATFGAQVNLIPTNTFTADMGPIAFLYS